MIKLPSRVSFRATQWIILLQNLFSFFNQIYFRYEHSIINLFMVFTNVDRRMTGAWSHLVVELSETLTARSWNLWDCRLTSSGCGAPRAVIKIICRSWYSFHPATFILKFYTCLLSTTLNLVQLVWILIKWIADTVTELGVPTLLTLSEVLLY